MPPPPSLLGDRYAIGDLLGRGGMADVYRAHDTVLDRAVAIKIMRDHSDDDIALLAEEALLLSTLHAETIVALLDAGVGDESPWIALELVDGQTLRDRMLAGPLDVEDVQHVGHQVASGLAHAHARGIVHRDVKPSNIMCTTDGTIKLADFGIARRDDARLGAGSTGYTVGTAAYVSPEQVRGEGVTGAADVYSLGLVLLEALTGVRAYPGPSSEAALARLETAPLIPASLPRGWPGLVAAMTATDPGERPSAGYVADRLSPEQVPAAASPDLTTTATVPIVAPPGGGSVPVGLQAGTA